MDHNREFRRNRLLGLALQLERGQLDAEFAAAAVPIAAVRQAVADRIRQLVVALEERR